MEEVRERIIYKSTPIEICLKKLTSIEQYELVRLLAVFPEKRVHICTHDNTSPYVDTILKRLSNIVFSQCFFPTTIAPCSDISASLTK